MFIYRQFDSFNKARIDINRREGESNLILKIRFHNDGPLFPASRLGSSWGADNGVVDLRSQTGRSGATETRHLKAVTRDSSFDGPERQAPHDMLLDEEGQD
jgi:hypothetical protein